VRGIGVRFAAYSGLSDLIPFYGLYTVLFAQTGLTGAEIASLLIIWSLTSLLLEVPSGALADVVSRRALLAAAGLIRVVGFGLWAFAPGYTAFAAGFVLWGVGSALESGTLQALVHDELAAIGEDHHYQRVLSWAETANLVCAAVGTLSAVPVHALGGYAAIGAVSMLACVGQAVTGLSFPRRPRVTSVDGPTGVRAWTSMLGGGLREAAGVRAVRRMLLLSALLPAMTALDELFPFVALDAGAAVSLVPVLTFLPMLGQIFGGATAGWQRSGRAVGALVVAGGVAIMGGALVGWVWWGFAFIAFGYGALQHASVVCDARLQAAVRGPARATVTSVAGFGAELATLPVYALWAGAAVHAGEGPAVAVVAAPLLGLGVLVMAWLPRRFRAED
jgi:MFS family permease